MRDIAAVCEGWSPCWRTPSTAHSRGQLGAHFIHRAFVEPMVQAVVKEPLLEEWNGVKAAASMRDDAGDRA